MSTAKSSHRATSKRQLEALCTQICPDVATVPQEPCMARAPAVLGSRGAVAPAGLRPPRTAALLVYGSCLVPQSKPFPRSHNGAARKRPEILTRLTTISTPFCTYTCNFKPTTCKGTHWLFFLTPFSPRSMSASQPGSSKVQSCPPSNQNTHQHQQKSHINWEKNRPFQEYE